MSVHRMVVDLERRLLLVPFFFKHFHLIGHVSFVNVVKDISCHCHQHKIADLYHRHHKHLFPFYFSYNLKGKVCLVSRVVVVVVVIIFHYIVVCLCCNSVCCSRQFARIIIQNLLPSHLINSLIIFL